MNIKKLYQFDGYVVKEMLKVIFMLYNVMKINLFSQLEIDNEDDLLYFLFDILLKVKWQL